MCLVLGRLAAKHSIDSKGEGGVGEDFVPVVIDSLSSLFGIDLFKSLRLSLPAATGLPTIIGGLIRKVRLFPGPVDSILASTDASKDIPVSLS